MDAKESALELMKFIEQVCEADGVNITLNHCTLSHFGKVEGKRLYELSIDAWDRRREEVFTLDVSAPTLQLLYLEAEKAGLGSFIYDLWQYANGAYDRDQAIWDESERFEKELYNNR